MLAPESTDKGPASAVAIGRYELHGRLASGGMASVHLGRLRGEGGFARVVAIKRLHPHLGEDPAFVSMFLDEAKLAARIRHPNVVPTLDVVAAPVAGAAPHGGPQAVELLLVMDYVAGVSLAQLCQLASAADAPIPLPIAARIVVGALRGLHAAHEARDEQGEPLAIVHRDVSPQNVLVGSDGIARLLDFGVAKASSRLSETRDGEIKGKVAYMSPEQVRGKPVDRRTDVYAAGVVLWEVLTGKRLHRGENDASTIEHVLYGTIASPRLHAPGLPVALDEVVLRALQREPGDRFPTAKEMADALDSAFGSASMEEVSAWVEATAGGELARHTRMVGDVERAANVVSGSLPPHALDPLASAHHGTLTTSGSVSRDADDLREASDTVRTRRRAARLLLPVGGVAVTLALVAVGYVLRGDPAVPTTIVPLAAESASPPPAPVPSASTAVNAPSPSSPPTPAPSTARTSSTPSTSVTSPPLKAPTTPPHRSHARGSGPSGLPSSLPSDRE